MDDNSFLVKQSNLPLETQAILLDAYAILSKPDIVFDRPAYKKIKRQALSAVLYELSTNNIDIPQFYQHIKFSEYNYKAILSFFIAHNFMGMILVLLGLFLSISSFLLLSNFTEFRESSTVSISIGMLLVFYFLKKHLDLKTYERFIKFLKSISYKKN